MTTANENALRVIESCLQIIYDDVSLKLIQDAVIQKRIDLEKIKPRSYKRKGAE